MVDEEGGSLVLTEWTVAMGDAMHGDEESPEEDHDGHVFCDWKVLESQCVGDLGNQDT